MTATCTHCDSTFRNVDRNEDGSPAIETTRCAHPTCQTWLCHAGCEHLSFACEGCTKRFCNSHKFTVDAYPYCIDCALADIEAQEPACECQQIDVDLVDPRGCELCNSSSEYNVRRRATEAEYELRAVLTDAGCTPEEITALRKAPSRQQGELFMEVS
jgi:hypothetical protein